MDNRSVRLEAIPEACWAETDDKRVQLSVGSSTAILTLAELRDLERRARDMHTALILQQARRKITQAGPCSRCDMSDCICY